MDGKSKVKTKKRGKTWVKPGVLLYKGFHAKERDGGRGGGYFQFREELFYWHLVANKQSIK